MLLFCKKKRMLKSASFDADTNIYYRTFYSYERRPLFRLHFYKARERIIPDAIPIRPAIIPKIHKTVRTANVFL